jgi:hypothetical protein
LFVVDAYFCLYVFDVKSVVVCLKCVDFFVHWLCYRIVFTVGIDIKLTRLVTDPCMILIFAQRLKLIINRQENWSEPIWLQLPRLHITPSFHYLIRGLNNLRLSHIKINRYQLIVNIKLITYWSILVKIFLAALRSGSLLDGRLQRDALCLWLLKLWKFQKLMALSQAWWSVSGLITYIAVLLKLFIH